MLPEGFPFYQFNHIGSVSYFGRRHYIMPQNKGCNLEMHGPGTVRHALQPLSSVMFIVILSHFVFHWCFDVTLLRNVLMTDCMRQALLV